jgi:hypothetical protein
MDADLLLGYLNKNYPQHITSDLAIWSINSLEEMDVTAGQYCADWELEKELSDELAAALDDLLKKMDGFSGGTSYEEASIVLKKWKELRQS